MRAWIYLGIITITMMPTVSWSETAFADLLAGKVHPLSITLKEMGTEWRQFTLTGGQNGMTDFVAAMARMRTGHAGGETYYTRGDVATCGEETFLVAYRVETGPIDFQAIMEEEEDLPVLPIDPDTVVTLSLLNLRMVGGMESIQPVEQARKARLRSVTISNLKLLSLAIQMYSQDNNGQYPPLDTVEAMKAAIGGYLGGADEMFIDPLTDEPFQPNKSLSRKKEADIDDPTSMAAIYQRTPGPDGLRAVGFVDGRAKFVNAEEWEKIKKASGIE